MSFEIAYGSHIDFGIGLPELSTLIAHNSTTVSTALGDAAITCIRVLSFSVMPDNA